MEILRPRLGELIQGGGEPWVLVVFGPCITIRGLVAKFVPAYPLCAILPRRSRRHSRAVYRFPAFGHRVGKV